MQYRRFGKTELSMPVISCGGMRYQHGWNESEAVTPESDRNVAACLHRAFDLGIHHFETARGYGTSELQVGKALPEFQRDQILVQTKVHPKADVDRFIADFEKSMSLLGVDYLDLFAFHGINDEATLEATLACYDTVDAWRRAGRIRHVGFATHGPAEIIVQAVETGLFEYVNLHWFYVDQTRGAAVRAAAEHDMGVFIISPNDKGGHLYHPSEKFARLTAPFHPMVFNALFCLATPEIHTLSCGVAYPEEFDVHMETAAHADRAEQVIAPIVDRLDEALREAVGEEWLRTWRQGLPEWHETPGEINIPVILQLRNLVLGLDMYEYGEARYNLLGNGGAWFPGQKADQLDRYDLTHCLRHSPHAERIPALLAETHAMLEGEARTRLQQAP